MSGIPAGAGSLLGKRLGKYEILALLALGGTAEIYLARIGGAAGFEKYVVVKCLHDHLNDDQEFVKMFLDEARLAAHLDHSNIVQTMELGEHEHRYYMVMEFLAGLSLAMVIRRAGERLQRGLIPVPLVLNLIAQACAGLHYAHERAVNGRQLNIVHRDISPQNLVISFEGVCKVVDFGIAKAEMRETKTRSGTIKGKFAYMSPEQCIATNVDRRTDVFALGVIAHELLTGRRLFKRNSPYETYQAVIECAVPAPSSMNHELDPALDQVIMPAVAKDADQRYPTAEAFGDALLGYLHHRGKGSGPGEVARFFEASFAQEIEEHAGRMRELISGRELPAEPAVLWGTDEEEAKRNQTIDLSRKTPGVGSVDPSLETADLIDDRPSVRSLEVAETPPADDSDMPSDRTRIETNPLAKEEAMDTVLALPSSIVPGPLPLPAPPTGPPDIGAQRPSAARFPHANLPTQLAPEAAKTSSAPNAATMLTGDIVDPNHGAPPANGDSTRDLPLSYPVMSAEFSEQMQRGGVFPSVPRGGRTHADSNSPRNAPSTNPPSTNPPSTNPPSTNPPDTRPTLGEHAASLASPVGRDYPKQVDWAQAAAMPARALPTWMMVGLFVAAIVVALLVTLIFAKIVR